MFKKQLQRHHQENRIRASKNSFIKAAKILAKIAKINFFKTLNVNHTLILTQNINLQRSKKHLFIFKWLNLSKNSKLCGVLTCAIPTSLSSAQ